MQNGICHFNEICKIAQVNVYPCLHCVNLFDWGISLQLLRRFKVYNKKGNSDRWSSRIVQSMAINLEVWIEDEKRAHLRDHS